MEFFDFDFNLSHWKFDLTRSLISIWVKKYAKLNELSKTLIKCSARHILLSLYSYSLNWKFFCTYATGYEILITVQIRKDWFKTEGYSNNSFRLIQKSMNHRISQQKLPNTQFFTHFSEHSKLALKWFQVDFQPSAVIKK